MGKIKKGKKKKKAAVVFSLNIPHQQIYIQFLFAQFDATSECCNDNLLCVCWGVSDHIRDFCTICNDLARMKEASGECICVCVCVFRVDDPFCLKQALYMRDVTPGCQDPSELKRC